MLLNETPIDGIGISIVPIDAIAQSMVEDMDSETERENEEKQLLQDSLAGYVISKFIENRDARRQSGVEQEILDSLLAYNAEYSEEDKVKIGADNGSTIFMNLTATKAKIAKSWITDILKPAYGKAWSLEPTPVASLPTDTMKLIEQKSEERLNEILAAKDTATQESNTEVVQQGQQQGQVQGTVPAPAIKNTKLIEAQRTITELNQERRDVIDVIRDEIKKEAKFQLSRMEQYIDDQLTEGEWDTAFEDFLDDFVIYPTAFIKGPIISKKTRLTWKNGEPEETEEYCYMNKCIRPIDMYPSADATSLQDGTLIEHMRLSKSALASLKNAKGYKTENIIKVLEEGSGASWLDTGIESEKADLEKRGSDYQANKDLYHCLQMHGAIDAKLIKEWSEFDPEYDVYEDSDVLEVDVLLVNNTVIKCKINKDPLLRRPYYASSFYRRPGSIWGRSIPSMMKDIQRMCNAVARALSNNLGIASGPQVEVYIDRLADNGDIEDITPFKIWQVSSDPTGSSGRAVQFWQPQSNAGELLAVYEKFEAKADDVTGIPRYAYGNDRLAGTATTATGLSILLESASKVIKDAIRNIDNGIIKPRIEYQFYWNMIQNNNEIQYTGDIKVVPFGSSILTAKSAQQMRKNEFLQITANQFDQQLMGEEGRARIIREYSKELGFTSDVVPNALDIRFNIEENKKIMAANAQAEMEEKKAAREVGLQATIEQISGQERMHQISMQTKLQDLNAKIEQMEKDREVDIEKIRIKAEADSLKQLTALQAIENSEAGKDRRQTQEIAVKLSPANKSKTGI